MSIDPRRVPAFPLYTLQISADHKAVILDGAPVPVDSEEEFAAAGTGAVIAKMYRQGLSAVRVAAIDVATADTWEMIIAVDGEVLDLTDARDAEAQTQERHRKNHHRLFIAVSGTLVLLLIAAVSTAVILTRQPTPQLPVYQPVGAGATLPAAPPPSHSPVAAWSLPAAAGSTLRLINENPTPHAIPPSQSMQSNQSMQLGRDLLLMVDPDDSLVGRDPATGAELWRGSRAPLDVRAIHLTRWAGNPVFAATTDRELLLWPATLPAGTSSLTPTAIPVATGQSARVDVGTPYIDLGDWYIKLPDAAGKLHEVMIPPGSAVLTTTGEGDIITASHTTLYTLNNLGIIINEKPYMAPADTSGYPTRIWSLDAENLLLGWEKNTRTLAVLNMVSGQITLVGASTSLPEKATTVLVDEVAKTAVLGSTALRYGTNPVLIDLGSTRATALHGTTVFANSGTGPITLDLNQQNPAPVSWEPYGPEDQSPLLVTDDAAYLIATQLERSVLYRSDRQR